MAIVAYYGQKVAGVWYIIINVCDVKYIDLHIFDPFVAENGFSKVWIVIETPKCFKCWSNTFSLA